MITYREATEADVPAIAQARRLDEDAGSADPRMLRYLKGEHHPQKALSPRVIFVGLREDKVVGYIAGHLTRRYDCDGELQWLWVAREHRRHGVASKLLDVLTLWFRDHEARRVCVDVTPDNARARAFYARHGAVELNPHWLVWPDIEVVLRQRSEPG